MNETQRHKNLRNIMSAPKDVKTEHWMVISSGSLKFYISQYSKCSENIYYKGLRVVKLSFISQTQSDFVNPTNDFWCVSLSNHYLTRFGLTERVCSFLEMVWGLDKFLL